MGFLSAADVARFPRRSLPPLTSIAPSSTSLPSFHVQSYYYGGHRKLSTYYYGLGNQHRRLQENAPFSVRPLFGNSFMPAAQGGAADVPVPQFLTRQLQGAGRQLTTYYYSNRRLQSRQLSTYYYGTHL